MSENLTYRQANFCREYVSNGGNATRAYLASYDTDNYETARTEAAQLLKKESVQAEILALAQPRKDEQKSERERIKDILWDIAGNTAEKPENRCRAVDILNKMNAEYIQRTKDETERPALDALDAEQLNSILNA